MQDRDAGHDWAFAAARTRQTSESRFPLPARTSAGRPGPGPRAAGTGASAQIRPGFDSEKRGRHCPSKQTRGWAGTAKSGPAAAAGCRQGQLRDPGAATASGDSDVGRRLRTPAPAGMSALPLPSPPPPPMTRSLRRAGSCDAPGQLQSSFYSIFKYIYSLYLIQKVDLGQS